MSRDYYTTTEAADLLSVSPDTVLKWVKAGKISSFRTPGGHCRIPKNVVSHLLPGYVTEADDAAGCPAPRMAYQYCWNFHAEGGAVREECFNCVAYRSRAHRCYEMRDVPQEFGHLKLHCDGSCESCDYYRLMAQAGPSILVVSTSRSFADELQAEAQAAGLIMEISRSDYECAAKVEKFRPDYVVVDCSYGKSRVRELCRQVHDDPRIPYTRIVLASKTPDVEECCAFDIFAWIRKPFTVDQLKLCISSTGFGELDGPRSETAH